MKAEGQFVLPDKLTYRFSLCASWVDAVGVGLSDGSCLGHADLAFRRIVFWRLLLLSAMSNLWILHVATGHVVESVWSSPRSVCYSIETSPAFGPHTKAGLLLPSKCNNRSFVTLFTTRRTVVWACIQFVVYFFVCQFVGFFCPVTDFLPTKTLIGVKFCRWYLNIPHACFFISGVFP